MAGGTACTLCRPVPLPLSWPPRASLISQVLFHQVGPDFSCQEGGRMGALGPTW